MTLSNEQRIAEVEEALMLLMAVLAGQPGNATMEEKGAAKARLAELMEGIRARHK